MKMLRTAPAVAATFAWRSTRGALVALAVGAVFAFGVRGLVDAGVPDAWIWLWSITGFIAFTGGLSFWAVSASTRWARCDNRLRNSHGPKWSVRRQRFTASPIQLGKE